MKDQLNNEKCLFLKEIIENVATWNWCRLININENIKSYIKGLLTAECSSAGVEMIFSSYELVQSKLRNHLGNEKVAKLVFLFHELN